MTSPVEIQQRTINGSEGPHLLITGGVHGDEFEPMAAIRRIMMQVDGSDLRGRLTLAPVVNEAAYRKKHRFAEDDLDLARNCPGSADGSITLRTAFALSRLIQAADYFIDLHTGGTTLNILPMSGYSLHMDAKILDVQRAMARAFNLPVIWGTSPTLDGRSLSVARDANVPAIYAEYHGAATCDYEGVDAYVDGCLNVMAEVGMIDRQPPPSRVKHVVEDERHGSGHMQVQNPAPIEGFFEPEVTLGQRIESEDPIGTVCDVLGDDVRIVRSAQSGIVLMLKSFSRVDKDEGVGVVLESDRPLGGGPGGGGSS